MSHDSREERNERDDLIVGIDLGTTNSEVAAMVGGSVQVLAHQGETVMPSCVAVAPDGELLVGTPALNQVLVHPDRTVRSIKRQMGTGAAVELAGQSYMPQEISAMILRELKRRAELALGRPVRRAVITVPAYFSDAQRQATREAGEIAGLEVVRILNEPTAAALVYQGELADDRPVLVYDLGGGTFDVSVVDVHGDVTEVLASHGDVHLGGDDFDRLLAERLLERLARKGGIDVSGDPLAMNRILFAAQAAKCRLSQEPYARVREEHLATRDGRPVHLEAEVSREEYEGLVRPLLDRTLDSVHRALADAGLSPGGLGAVLLAGGATRTPLVGALLEEATGLVPRQDLHPDLCVALGAGVLASRLSGCSVPRVLVDVTPYSFGPSVFGELHGLPSPHRYVPIIRRNTPLPVSRTEVFATMVDNQREWDVRIFQGEDSDARDNILIGRFRAGGFAPAPEGAPILCRLDLDVDGILHVTVVEKRTGKTKHVTIEKATAAFEGAALAAARERLARLIGVDEADAEVEAVDAVDVGAAVDAAGAVDVGAAGGAAAETAAAHAAETAAAHDAETAAAHDAETAPSPAERARLAGARALLAQSRGLLDTMHPDDRRDAELLIAALEEAIGRGDWEAVDRGMSELGDLLFYVKG